MAVISRATTLEIARRMRSAGFEVEAGQHAGSLAFTCPPRSRLVFGAVIADVLGGTGPAMGMLRAAHTSHNRETRQVTLYFPGYTVAS